MLTPEVLDRIDRSVLCWLATASEEGVPNVSPKEIFAARDDCLLIANIASPQSARNVRQNSKVCVSFIDILVQKGFQVFGQAELVKKSDDRFESLAEPLLRITHGQFPFATLFRVAVTSIKPIVAPRYVLYPDTTEADQIADAIRTYRLDR